MVRKSLKLFISMGNWMDYLLLGPQMVKKVQRLFGSMENNGMGKIFVGIQMDKKK